MAVNIKPQPLRKQKDAAVYNRKVKKLFQTMDASGMGRELERPALQGDGAINLEELLGGADETCDACGAQHFLLWRHGSC